MSKQSLLLALAAALAGAALANLTTVSAEPQPAWDNDLVRQLVRAQQGQEKALEALVRSSEQQTRAAEQQTRALENIARALEKCQR
jgi:hypothetical protein